MTLAAKDAEARRSPTIALEGLFRQIIERRLQRRLLHVRDPRNAVAKTSAFVSGLPAERRTGALGQPRKRGPG